MRDFNKGLGVSLISLFALPSFDVLSNDASVSIPITVSFNSYCTILGAPSSLSFKGASDEILSDSFEISWRCFGTDNESLRLYFSTIELPSGGEVIINERGGDISNPINESNPVVLDFENGSDYTTQFTASILLSDGSERKYLKNWSGTLNGVFELR